MSGTSKAMENVATRSMKKKSLKMYRSRTTQLAIVSSANTTYTKASHLPDDNLYCKSLASQYSG